MAYKNKYSQYICVKIRWDIKKNLKHHRIFKKSAIMSFWKPTKFRSNTQQDHKRPAFRTHDRKAYPSHFHLQHNTTSRQSCTAKAPIPPSPHPSPRLGFHGEKNPLTCVFLHNPSVMYAVVWTQQCRGIWRGNNGGVADRVRQTPGTQWEVSDGGN